MSSVLSAQSFFNQAIELNKNDDAYYYWRSITLQRLSRFQEASADQLIAKSIEPNNKRYNKKVKDKELLLENKSVKKQAAISYKKALSAIKNNNPDVAVIELMSAIDADPHQIEFYLAFDMVLGQTKQWLPIINQWKKYIALYPNNSRAHFEVSGTYHHNKNPKKSIYHLKKAADLGHKEAINITKRLGV